MQREDVSSPSGRRCGGGEEFSLGFCLGCGRLIFPPPREIFLSKTEQPCFISMKQLQFCQRESGEIHICSLHLTD